VNKLREAIKQVLEEKKKATLKELYASINSNPSNIRAVLNLSIKKGKTFNRVARGTYELKAESE
jgi:hypothetical protein